VESDRAARAAEQLAHSGGVVQRLAKRFPVDLGNLVGTDDERIRKPLREGNCFLAGESISRGGRQFTDARRFIDARCGGFKGDAESGEKLAPIGRRGGQDQPSHRNDDIFFDKIKSE
jgi:hypothetical protein